MTTADLLLFVASSSDPHRFAVAPALAAAAARAGWAFDLYYDAARAGRHFGGGEAFRSPGLASGSLVAGGHHAEQVAWLASRYRVSAVGDPASVLWPAIEACSERSLPAADPAEVYSYVFGLLGEDLPQRCLVLDGAEQGPHRVVTAPYAFPAFFEGDACVGVDASAPAGLCEALEAHGVRSFSSLWVSPPRCEQFPRRLAGTSGAVNGRSYAEVTAELAARHGAWGRGVLLGDPALVAAQLPRATRRRLLPMFGVPQVDVIEAASAVLHGAEDPAWGRQYDDRDFFELARHGLGLQVVDPDPPFDAMARAPHPVRARWPEPGGVPDSRLRGWVAERRLLACPLFWCGMVRELDALRRVIDVLAATGLKAGIVVTTETLAHAPPGLIDLLVAPPERGGVGGQVELLLGSTGRGVAAEALLPPGRLASQLRSAREELAAALPAQLVPAGWWPLLDAPLVGVRPSRVGWREGVPVLWRGDGPGAAGGPPGPHRPVRVPRSAPGRVVLGRAVRALGAGRFLEQRRPYHAFRPGPFDGGVAEAVRSAGFGYQFTKAAFGEPVVVHRDGSFVALPFTAGEWDGWSPFYTVASALDVRRAARRLGSPRRPGWIVSTIDTPLWALSGEALEHGGRLRDIARAFTGSPRFVNVLPSTIAAYARLLGGTGPAAG